jgi:hypothetical protein
MASNLCHSKPAEVRQQAEQLTNDPEIEGSNPAVIRKTKTYHLALILSLPREHYQKGRLSTIDLPIKLNCFVK